MYYIPWATFPTEATILIIAILIKQHFILNISPSWHKRTQNKVKVGTQVGKWGPKLVFALKESFEPWESWAFALKTSQGIGTGDRSEGLFCIKLGPQEVHSRMLYRQMRYKSSHRRWQQINWPGSCWVVGKIINIPSEFTTQPVLSWVCSPNSHAA